MTIPPVVTCGEIMLRLATPGCERFLQSPQFAATFGGAEANVATALVSLGQPSSFVTVLPDNPLADACIAQLRGFGVGTEHITRGPGRLGIYYLEHGAGQRPSKVVYDRAGSSFATAARGIIEWKQVFHDASFFHISGVTPAISETAAALALESMRAAKQAGVRTSFDLNYRKNLWKWGRSAGEVLPELIRLSDVFIANEDHLQTALGFKVDVDPADANPAEYRALSDQALAAYPNVATVVVTVRRSHGASHNSWSACLNNREQFITSHRYEIVPIVDRVGSGDSFAAGIIYGLLNLRNPQDVLEFAAALGCLKHSIPGDFCRVTRAEVNALLNDNSGQVQR